MRKDGIALETLIYQYHVHNRTEGKSPSTVEWYDEALRLFLRWLEEGGRPTNLGGVDRNTAREFVLHLQERGLSTHTVNNRVRALRAFFAWLHREGFTETHLLGLLRPPRVAQIQVEPLSQEEMAALFRRLDQSTELGARNAATLALFLDAGLRLSELVNLGRGDVHVEDQYVRVVGKGNKERIVPFGHRCQRLLLRYALHFRPDPLNPARDRFFLAPDGTPVTNTTVYQWLRRLGRAVGIDRLHPHLLRHTYATEFLMNGGNLLLLKQNLGHTTVAMVDRYAHIAERRAAVQAREFSPLDRAETPIPLPRRTPATAKSRRRRRGSQRTLVGP